MYKCFGTLNNAFITNSLLSLSVEEFWKLVSIWWSCGQE